MSEKRKIINFLKQKGFVREEGNHYITTFWSVDTSGKEVEFADPTGHSWFIPMNVYAVAGFLTIKNKP